MVPYTYLGFEGDLGGLEGVGLGEHDADGKRAAGVRAAGGAVDDHLEVVRVRQGDAPGWQNAGGSINIADSSFWVRLVDSTLLPSSICRRRPPCRL